MQRSLDPSMLANKLPGNAIMYSFRFVQDSANQISLHCLWQNDFALNESFLHGFIRKAGVALDSKDRAGIAMCKGVRGIARRVDELSRLRAKASSVSSYSLARYTSTT